MTVDEMKEEMFQMIKRACEEHILKKPNLFLKPDERYCAAYLLQASKLYPDLTQGIQLQEEGTDDNKLPKTTTNDR